MGARAGCLVGDCFVAAAMAALLPLAVIATLGVTHDQAIIPLAMRDMAATGMLHPGTGALSSLGAFLWFAAACICLFTLQLPQVAKGTHDATFLGWSAALSLYLWFDDYFMFHEHLAPSLGLHEKAVLLALAGGIAAYVWRFRGVLVARENALLVAAIGLLGLSVIADVLLPRVVASTHPWAIMIEDGLKWLGICGWTAFHVRNCRRIGAAVPAPA